MVSGVANQARLVDHYLAVRNDSLGFCEQLSPEDMQAQSMPDASPVKWHLAHTSWAFETFALKPNLANYQSFDPEFEYLFNSYYNAIGEQYPRSQRGLLTRPTLQTVLDYRHHVDQAMQQLIESLADAEFKLDKAQTLESFILLLINHEQQHQELMATDLKHLLSFNPKNPETHQFEYYQTCQGKESVTFDAGLYSIGHQDEAFYFDNEGPVHQFYAAPFRLDVNLVSNGEYLEFIQCGGYTDPQYWLSEAWQLLNQTNLRQPLYWQQQDDRWFEFTLGGLVALQLDKPVTHINYFEANAFANWKNKRLPTEQEWEIAAKTNPHAFNQLFNQAWQWTSSSYCAYPGFKPMEGAIGEYNGKFMVNQYVLRGGSVATPNGHIRASYRNFFYPSASWQFTSIRLAESI